MGELVRTTPNVLYDKMDAADKMRKYSYNFWHITSFENAISIIKNKAFYSRKMAEDSKVLKFDNRKRNETTKGVINTNRSSKTILYVRFYFTPDNSPFYALKGGMERSGTVPVLFAVRRSALHRSKNKTLVVPHNAHYAEENIFDNPPLNVGDWDETIMIDKGLFNNLDIVYSKYNPNSSIHDELEDAEFLVYNSLSTRFVHAIYFLCEEDKERFRKAVRPLDRQGIELIVDKGKFGGGLWYK